MVKPNKVLQYIFMANIKLFILKQSCIFELRVHYIDNHLNNLQFSIQFTVSILKLLSIGARIVPLCVI